MTDERIKRIYLESTGFDLDDSDAALMDFARNLLAAQAPATQDVCEVCDGAKGGVPGNDNIIDGRRVCDYCHADGSYKASPQDGAPLTPAQWADVYYFARAVEIGEFIGRAQTVFEGAALASNKAAAIVMGEPTASFDAPANVTQLEALKEMFEAIRAIPTRIEFCGGQSFRYVKLCEVLDTIAELNATPAAPIASADEAITQAAALAFIDQFEIVGDNNDSRDPTDEEKFVLHEFVLQLFDGEPDQSGAARQTCCPLCAESRADVLSCPHRDAHETR